MAEEQFWKQNGQRLRNKREQEAREQAEAEVQAAAEEARRATELATQLEAEARKLAAEETRAAALAAKAQARADAAAASVDGLTTKAKELGINTPAKTMAGVNFASFVPKLEDVGARFTKPKAEKPKKKEQIKSKSQPELAALQGNSGRIDRNMSESRCPKLQKIDRKLSKMTES
jgi:hypothetical protein